MNVRREIWYTFVDFVRTFGALQLFFVKLVANAPSIILRRGGLVIKQVYNTGALSLVIIMVCGFFVGGVLGLQGFSNLSKFNAEDSVGTFAAFSLLKELGPVITALLFAGRAGTALASEIGLMKATDQLSAMEMMAINPLRRVLVPRFLGGVISMPMLALFTLSMPRHWPLPACQARLVNGTYCTSSPSRRISRCEDTRIPSISAK